MAKTFDKSIQNGAISIHFFVKWQFSFRVTFQAFYVHEKFSSFCWQHHTLKSTTVWMFSLVVWCSANKNMTIPWKKYPKKYDRSWKIFLFHGHFLSSFPAEVDKISKYWPKLNIQTANCCPCCSLSYKCTLANFTADSFRLDKFFWLPVKGLNEAIEAYNFIT